MRPDDTSPIHQKPSTDLQTFGGAIAENPVKHVRTTQVREQFRVLTGLLADSNAETITLLDEKNKRTVLNRADLEELNESPVSLMPEKLLDKLTDQQIRDLIAYIQSSGK